MTDGMTLGAALLTSVVVAASAVALHRSVPLAATEAKLLPCALTV